MLKELFEEPKVRDQSCIGTMIKLPEVCTNWMLFHALEGLDQDIHKHLHMAAGQAMGVRGFCFLVVEPCNRSLEARQYDPGLYE